MGRVPGRVTPSRVLFFSQAPGVGGGERAVLPLLTRLDAVDLVVAAPAPVAEYARSLGAAVIEVELPRAHRLVHGARVLRGARRVRQLVRTTGANLLYANGTRAIPYAVGAAVIGARPLLFHHHGLLERGPVRTLVRASSRFADAIVVPSTTAALPFRAWASKVHVIPNGIDVEQFRPDGRRPIIDPDMRSAAAVVATLTRPDRSKGMSEFVDLAAAVAESLPSAQFVVGGGPVFPHETKPYRLVRERARMLGSRMTLTGRVEDPAAFYRTVDVFVHLGRPEGFGLTVLEALASGVPVVAYDWGAIPEVFAGLVALVPPGDIGAAADAVVRLATDAPRRARMAAHGRAAVEERFAAERTAAALCAVIESVAAAET